MNPAIKGNLLLPYARHNATFEEPSSPSLEQLRIRSRRSLRLKVTSYNSVFALRETLSPSSRRGNDRAVFRRRIAYL